MIDVCLGLFCVNNINDRYAGEAMAEEEEEFPNAVLAKWKDLDDLIEVRGMLILWAVLESESKEFSGKKENRYNNPSFHSSTSYLHKTRAFHTTV